MTAPAGNINAPNPDLVVNTYDVGTISGIGFNFQGGGAAEQYDELRVGTSYGSVVGASAGATIATTLSLSVSSGKEVSWTANNTDSYQPQSSTDGINWNNLGGVLTGSAVTSIFDPAPVANYRVLDYTFGHSPARIRFSTEALKQPPRTALARQTGQARQTTPLTTFGPRTVTGH